LLIFSRFLLIPVFYIIQTGIATWSIESRADLPGQPEFNNYVNKSSGFFYVLSIIFRV
jgi:hypothetical protein